MAWPVPASLPAVPWPDHDDLIDLTDNKQQPRPYNNPGYLQNGASGLPPGAAPLLPNQGRVIQTGPIRVLCIADVRGEKFAGNLAVRRGDTR